jgi:hypothetical protein
MPKDEVWEEFQNRVNMTPGELRSWKDSDNFDVYRERKSGGEDITQPVNDAIRLLETPKADWKDKDDGFNEVEEAEQLLDFTSRMRGVNKGEPMPDTDPPLSKRDASLINWAFDPNPDKSDFVGDRQR